MYAVTRAHTRLISVDKGVSFMKKLLKLTTFVIALLVVATVFAAGADTTTREVAFAAADYGATTAVLPTGSGTAGDPYVLTSAENFKWLDENLSAAGDKYFVLGSDVDFSGVSGFYPVGAKTGASFVGTFDGNGHSVLNLTVSVASGDAGAGLFVRTENATFKNLSLENVVVESPADSMGGYLVSYVGALSGVSIGTKFENVTVKGGSVSGKTNVGGLVGAANDCAFSYVRTDSTVKVSYGNLSSFGVAGGIVGNFIVNRNNRAMDYCYSLSDVNGSTTFKNNLGGLIGRLDFTEFEENGRTVTRKFDFNYCYFAGVVNYSADSEGNTSDIYGSFTSNNLVDATVGFRRCLYSAENKSASDVIYPYQNGRGLKVSEAKGLTREQLKTPSEVISCGWDFDGVWIIDLSKAALDEFGSYPDFTSAYEGNSVIVYFKEIVGGVENNNSDRLNYKGGVRFVKGNVVNLKFANPTGYRLGEFLVGGTDRLAEVTDGSYDLTVPDGDTVVSFSFMPMQYKVIISNSANGVVNVGGRVEDGKDDFDVDYGSVAEFTLRPDRYYEFLKITITGADGKSVKYDEVKRGESYKFVVRSDTTVSVEWVKKTAYLAVILNSDDYGSVETSLDGDAFRTLYGRSNPVDCGTKVTVRTKAASDAYRLFKWQYSVNGGTSWIDDVLYDNLSGDRASGAWFENGYYYYEKIIPDGINGSDYLVRAFYEDVRSLNLKIGSLEGGTFKVSANNKFAVVAAIDGVEQDEVSCIGDSFVWEEGKTYTIIIEGGTMFFEATPFDGYKTVVKKGNTNVGSIQPKTDGENFSIAFEKVQYTLSLSTKSFDSNYFMYSDALDGTYAKVSSSNTLYGELGKEIYVAFHLGSSKFKGWLTAENGMTISDFGAGTFEKDVNFWEDVDVDGTGKRFVVYKYVFGKDTVSSVYADNVSLWSVTVNKNFPAGVGDAYIYSVDNKRTTGNPDSVNVENGSKVAVYVKVAPNYSLDFTKFTASNLTQRVERVGDEDYNVYLIEFDNITQFTGIAIYIGRSPVVPSLEANNSKYGTVEARNANSQLYIGDKITVVATANAGYRFSHWQVTTDKGTETVKNSTYVHTITGANDRLVAVFVSTESQTTTYTVSLRAGKGIKTVGGEEEFYYNGDTVSIYAETKAGYEFEGWYNVATGAKISGNINYDFTIASDIVLEARAVEKTFKIDIKTIAGGEITCSPMKTEYNLGDSVTFTFTAKEGYKFAGWQVNGSDYEAATTTFTITISRDISISAVVDEVSGGGQTIVPETTYTVDISVNDATYGYVEYSAKKIIKGGSVTMTAYAKSSDYEFKYWVQNNVPVSTERTFVLSDVQDNCTIVAVFEPAKRTLAYTTTDTEAVNINVSATSNSVGSLETVSATARLGYRITKVTIKGLGAGAFADDNGTPTYENGVWTYIVGGKEYKYYESTGEWELEVNGKAFAEDLLLNNDVAVHIEVDKTGYTAIEWMIALGVTLLLLAFLVAVILVMKAEPNDSIKKIISEMKGEKYKTEMADAAASATVNTSVPQGFGPRISPQSPISPNAPQGPISGPNANAMPQRQAGMPQQGTAGMPQRPQAPINPNAPQGPRPSAAPMPPQGMGMQRPPMNAPKIVKDDDDVPDYDPDDDDD